MLATLCEVAQVDTEEYRVEWVTQLLVLFNDSSDEVVAAAWTGLDALVKSVPKDELEELVVPLRRSLESITPPGQEVPGFSRPKGAQPIVPILLAGLLTGTEQQKEQAAYGIGDLVQRTSDTGIKPYIIQLTGPLIRVISNASLGAQIKGAILSTLAVLLQSVPQLVRPFHPQLTRTMIKNVTDGASSSVRSKAAAGLGELMKHQPRVDPLVTELLAAVKTVGEEIAPSVVTALAVVTESALKNMGPGVKQGLEDLVSESTDGAMAPYVTAIGKLRNALSGETQATAPPKAASPEKPKAAPEAPVKPEEPEETRPEAAAPLSSSPNGALQPITTPPKYSSPEEHARLTSTTPTSFSDLPPVLGFQDDKVRIEFDPVYQGKSEYKGSLWVTEA